MPGLNCKLFRSPKVSNSTLREKLSGYKRKSEPADGQGSLLENVEEFAVSHGVARFKYLYDYVDSVPRREETQTITRTAVAPVAVVDPPADSTYFIYASSGIATNVAARVSQAVFGRDDQIDPIRIPSARLRELIDTEVIEIKYGWWDGIDTHARKGALKGNVLKSKYYTAFKKGEPTSMTYESKSTGRTIRLTDSGTITIYGKDVKPSDLEEYVIKVVFGG